MTLQDAEKIARNFGGVLARKKATDGLASCASLLPDSPERIVQAMKLWLALEIQKRSLTEEFRNEIGTVASRLPYFIKDDEARRLNSSALPKNTADLSTDDYAAKVNVYMEAQRWATSANIAGLAVRSDLSNFIAAVEQFDPDDSLYWQRVYTLAGLEYSPSKKRSFFDLFS